MVLDNVFVTNGSAEIVYTLTSGLRPYVIPRAPGSTNVDLGTRIENS